MKVLFIRPRPSAETIGLQHVMIVEPLELETLAALLDKRDSAVIVDMILERKPLEHFLHREKPDVVCVTGYITHVPIVIEYCRTVKRVNPGIRTIVGGVHCEVCPEHFEDESVEYRVVRNATIVFPRLIEAIRGAGSVPGGVLECGEEFHAEVMPPFDYFYPRPDRSLTERYRADYFYIFHDRVALIKTSFGCPYTCNFCFCRVITRGAYVERPLVDVMRELQSIREKNIYIVDDDFLVNRARLNEFIGENRRLGLEKHYLIYGRADFIAKHPGTMARLREVGLRTVIVGFESFFPDELASYDKGLDPATNTEAMRVLNDLHIDCYATVIIPPHWSHGEFRKCGTAMRDIGIHYVNLQPLTPLPATGSPIADERLVVSRADFTRWDLAHITVRPERMTLAEFYREILRLYFKILFRPHFLWTYFRRYRMHQIRKMLVGTFAVTLQYWRRIRAAKNYDALVPDA